jgi:hypothetical protein
VNEKEEDSGGIFIIAKRFCLDKNDVRRLSHEYRMVSEAPT